MGAAFQGYAELVRKLLAAGADPDTKNTAGLDARGFAVTFGRAEIAALLGAARKDDSPPTVRCAPHRAAVAGPRTTHF